MDLLEAIIFYYQKKQHKSRHALHGIFFLPRYIRAEVPQSSILMPPFSVAPLFWGYPKPQFRFNKMLNGVDYHHCF